MLLLPRRGQPTGDYAERWGVSEEECRRLCNESAACRGLEMKTDRRVAMQRCELHRWAPTHTLPMPGFLCFVKA